MEQLRQAVKLYLAALALAAIGVAALLLLRAHVPTEGRLWLALAFASLQALAVTFSLSYNRVTKVSLHTGVVFASVMLFEPGVAVLVAGAGTLLAHVPRRQTWDQTTFNTAQTVLQAGVAGSILAAFGWSYDALAPDVPALLGAVLLAAAAMYLVDSLSVATVVGLQAGRSPLDTWREVASYEGVVELLSQYALGVLAAIVADAAGWALPLVLLPAMVILRSTERQLRLREHADTLAHQAFHDPLTEMPNRVLFTDRLEHALARAARRHSRIAVLFVDLDRFKFVNDSLGHDAGDRLLVEVAARLHERLRPEDTVARHGGDEFTVLIEDVVDARDATRVARRITQELDRPFLIDGHEVRVTSSIGIAIGMPGKDGPADLLRAADAAMYRAKSRGKARYEVFDAQMGEDLSRRLELEADLRRAVERGELRLLYQPKVELSTGTLVGVEALLRWQHPKRGLVGPDEIIPLAEDIGLSLPLGVWVLREACRQAMEWRRRSPSRIAVCINLSATQLRSPSLPAELGAILRETGLAPDLLHLEMTESVVMGDLEGSVAAIRGLKAMGVELAMDGFGTGYSSLRNLKQAPMDYVKLDRSFVADLGRDAGSTAIVEAVIALARALGTEAVAVGVETEEQAELLRGLGCHIGQGYLFAPPLPPADIAPLLERSYQTA